MSDGGDTIGSEEIAEWERRVSRAVDRFVEDRVQRVARKVIWRLQRQPAANMRFDGLCRSLWDEYCYVVVCGFHPSTPQDTLSEIVIAYAVTVLETLPSVDHDLTFEAISHPGSSPPLETLVDLVEEAVRDAAAVRNVEKFEIGPR